MNSPILIKPHHFLDIIKLYGSGIETFVPDKKYGHDFYKIGNQILTHKDTPLVLTIHGDDICRPCQYFHDGQCRDHVEHRININSKETWNCIIDTKLLNQLSLEEGQHITAFTFSKIAVDKLTDIHSIWKGEPPQKTILRKRNLFKGLRKYLDNNV